MFCLHRAAAMIRRNAHVTPNGVRFRGALSINMALLAECRVSRSAGSYAPSLLAAWSFALSGQGYLVVFAFPGRCPGLSYCTPSAFAIH